jgi:transcriptional regulator with XRE-family HTH domain
MLQDARRAAKTDVSSESAFEAGLAAIGSDFRARVAELLIENLSAGDDGLIFAPAVCTAVDRCGITVEEICRTFSVDKASVSRWKNGLNAPHQHVRRQIMQWLVVRLSGSTLPAPAPAPAQPSDQKRPPLDPKAQAVTLPGFVLRWLPELLEREVSEVLLDDTGDVLLITLPAEAETLWLAGNRYRLAAVEDRKLTYGVAGLSHEQARAFAQLNEQNPWIYTFAWDPWCMHDGYHQYVRATA